MSEYVLDKHYEEEFKFPLLEMIKQRAEQKDISYAEAYREVLPEYQKTIRYKDTEWSDEQIRKRNKEIIELREKERQKKDYGG